ncbi:hypothetical protein KC335_g15811, partial [Hortaea werneckii]
MTSSPPTADFETAGSFNINNDQILNSTMNIPEHSMEQHLPLDYDDYPTQHSLDKDSEGSADMSIEMGRGGKRRADDHDVSSNLVFNFGSDGQYEVTGTPPARPRTTSRKSDAGKNGYGGALPADRDFSKLEKHTLQIFAPAFHQSEPFSAFSLHGTCERDTSTPSDEQPDSPV